jgi:hypothetical protein
MHTVARLPVKVRRGRFAARVALRRPAVHRLRVIFRGDAHNRSARSGDVYLRAVRPADPRPQRAVHALDTDRTRR